VWGRFGPAAEYRIFSWPSTGERTSSSQWEGKIIALPNRVKCTHEKLDGKKNKIDSPPDYGEGDREYQRKPLFFRNGKKSAEVETRWGDKGGVKGVACAAGISP